MPAFWFLGLERPRLGNQSDDQEHCGSRAIEGRRKLMKVMSIQFITGFMIGIEFPGVEGIHFVLDLGIIRIVIETVGDEE